MAAWVVAGDRAQLGLIVIGSGFRAAAPELQRRIVTSPAVVSDLNREGFPMSSSMISFPVSKVSKSTAENYPPE